MSPQFWAAKAAAQQALKVTAARALKQGVEKAEEEAENQLKKLADLIADGLTMTSDWVFVFNTEQLQCVATGGSWSYQNNDKGGVCIEPF